MRRFLFAFLLGVIVGAGGMFFSMRYHVVRAADGTHLIPKTAASLRDTYVDIRQFTLADWDAHRELGLAILQSDRADLLQDSALRTLRDKLRAL